MSIVRWWHFKRGHKQTHSKVTIGIYDPSRGVLTRCECGKVWAW